MSQGNSVEILEIRSDGFTFHPRPLLDALNKVGERPVAIYSINGPAGTGKSFLLNYFLRFLFAKGKSDWLSFDLKDHFSWRGGSGRNTNGILIWSEPFIIKRESDGREVGIILIDTQGSFDQDATMKDNAIVFALSTLISSVLIFNTKTNGRDIGEDKLQFLQFFAGYARLTDDSNQDEPFQSLIFLIRDFEINDYEYGFYDDKVTATPGKNFKVDMLDPKETQPEEVQIVHAKILSNFISVGCYLMPHPGKELARKDNSSKMDEEFVEHLQKFTELMLNANNLVTKKIGKKELTASQLMKFVNGWSTKFNNSKLPEVQSLYNSTVKIHDAMAKKAALDYFNIHMQDMMELNPRGMNEFQFKQRYDEITKSAISVLINLNPMGGEDGKKELAEDLKNDIEGQYNLFKMTNEHKVKFYKLEDRNAEKMALIERSLDNNRKRLSEINHKNNLFFWEEKERIVSQMEDYKRQMEELLILEREEKSEKSKKISRLEAEIQQIKQRRSKSCDNFIKTQSVDEINI